MTYIKETYTFDQYLSVPLAATFYRPTSTIDYQATLLYFHGGGLIFGQREDLPESYLELLTSAGYGVLSFDYLLAPESKLDTIIHYAHKAVNWFVDEATTSLALPNTHYYLFGRSAGAYLSLYLAAHADDRPQANGLIALYGYYTLNEASFSIPSRHFLQFNRVNDATVKALIRSKPLVAGPMDERFILYLAGRQSGQWLNHLLTPNLKAADYSLTTQQLQSLPPTFLAAAAQDPDVPARQSRLMSKHIRDAEFHLIDTNEHDFDRTQMETHGLAVYHAMIEWLNQHRPTT